MQNAQPTVLLVADRRNSGLKKSLRKAGFQALEAFTTDHAVAVCVNNRIDAVVLDQNWFVETEGWSVARSIKAVKPGVRVLLLRDAKKIGADLPEGVDGLVRARDPSEAVLRLEQLLSYSASSPSFTRLNSVTPKRSKILRAKEPAR